MDINFCSPLIKKETKRWNSPDITPFSEKLFKPVLDVIDDVLVNHR